MTDHVSVLVWHIRNTDDARCFSATKNGAQFWIPKTRISCMTKSADGECAISIPRSLAVKLKLRIYA